MEHKFEGKWITRPAFAGIAPVNVFHRMDESGNKQNATPQNSHMLFRKKFCAKGNAPVKMFITADDYYKLYINGKFVTEGPAPAFPFHYYYNELDVSEFVHSGENTVSVHVYYQGLNNRHWVSNDDRSGLIFDILEDGKLLSKSDDTVKCAKHTAFKEIGVTGYRLYYLQNYDSRAAEVGFEKPDFDDSAWENAAYCLHSDHVLVPQPTKQLDIYYVKPANVEKIEGGYRIDFGRNYIGYVTAKARGKNGETVLVRIAHELNEDGSIRYEYRASSTYQEEWVLSGREDAYSQYDYVSFRYAEFICEDGAEIYDIQAQVRHYPYTEKAKCRYDDPDLNRIWRLAADSLHYGVQDIIQDCIEREKGQYLGDGLYTSTAYAILTGDFAIFEKLIADTLRTHRIHRGLMICAPCSLMQESSDYVLLVPEFLLTHAYLTKNTEFANTWYDTIGDTIRYFEESFAGEDGLLRDVDQMCFIDWPLPARDGYDFVPKGCGVSYGLHNVVNAYYIGAIKAMNKLAEMLGREKFMDEEPIVKSFMDMFYDKKQGFFIDAEGSKHVSAPGNILALRYDFCPDKETEERIIKLIMGKEAHQTAFYTSFSVLSAFTRLGREKELKAYITNEGRWLRMLREGATTTFEAWGKDLKWNTSLFHLMYSFVLLYLTDWGQDELLKELRA